MPKCPWYNSGLCYSRRAIAKYGSPSPEPVVEDICLTNKFTSCPLYEKPGPEEGLAEALGVEIRKGYYPLVHVLSEPVNSDCPFYKLVKVGDNMYVAYCYITERYVTRSAVKKCALYWDKCPFYEIGANMELV